MADTPQELVRAGDKDIFLATLFSPSEVQADVFALYAFQLEISRIPSLVSEAAIGDIRLQWWAETLAAVERGEPQEHPVAAALQAAVQRHKFSITPLVDFVEAKRRELDRAPYSSTTDLELHLGKTHSVFFQLAAVVLAPELARGASDASGLGGVAFALSRALATAPERVIPQGMTIDDVRTLADRRWAQAREVINVLPKPLFPAFLPVALTPLYLAKQAVPPQWRRQWRLWRSAKVEEVY